MTIDTLRADHVSAYGYPRPTTPFLDSLAAEGIVFEQAYSTAPWTAPSMASIFTGLPSRAHGVEHGAIQAHHAWQHDILDDSFETLPEALRAAGYRTFGVTTNAHASAATGFDQGFDILSEANWEDADTANELAFGFAGRLVAEPSPWFLWVHYFDPHAPYRSWEGWIDRRADRPPDWKRFDGVSMTSIVKSIRLLRAQPRQLGQLIALYDAEIARTDDAIRRLFAKLEVGPEALVVVVADHGEGFLDHGNLGHGATLYDDQVRVPLIIRPPGGVAPPARRRDPASIMDVKATVLGAIGVPDTEPSAGRDLLAEGVPDGSPRPIPLDNRRSRRELVGLREGAWKYVHARKSARERVFNLEEDPAETRDLAADRPELVERLRASRADFDRLWPRFSAPSTAESLGQEEARRLEALGYAE